MLTTANKEQWQHGSQPAEWAHWRRALLHQESRASESALQMARYFSCILWARFGLFPDAFRGQTVIDVGCGPTGRLSCFENARVIGIDPLAPSYQSLPGKMLQTYDSLYDVPAEERIDGLVGRADVVVSLNCLDHCYDAAAVLRNMAAYLRPNGFGFLSTDTRLSTDADAEDLLHPSRMTAHQLGSLLNDAGVRINKVESGTTFPLFFAGRLVRWEHGWSPGAIARHWWFTKD